MLSDGVAAAWVLENELMAFGEHARADRLQVGDAVAVYVSRGAFHNPTRDEAQIVATGRVTREIRKDPKMIAGRQFNVTCHIALDQRAPLRHGSPFKSMVPHLSFIRESQAWGAYVRRGLVLLPDGDFEMIASALRKHLATPAQRT